MSRELTDKQQAFIEHFIESGDARAAATAAGYSEASIGSKASQLKKDLAPEIAKGVTEAFADGAPAALAAMKDIITNGTNESARMRAIDSWLDRAGHKPVDRHEEVKDTRDLNTVVQEMRLRQGDEAVIAFMRHEHWPEHTIRQLVGDAVDQYPPRGEQPAQLAAVPETKADRRHRRTLDELAAERKRFNLKKRA